MLERLKNIDVGLVYELWNEYADACRSGDLDRWMSLWVDDGIQMAPYLPARIGKEQIREGMKSLFEQFIMRDVVIDMDEVCILGDRAYSHGTYHINLFTKDGGEAASCSGKFLDIVKKQADGSWKLAIDCHNYNHHQE